MSDKNDNNNDKAKQLNRSDSVTSKSGSSDKVNDNVDEKDTEKQLRKSEDKAPPSRSYHFTNADDDDMMKSKHCSDNNIELSPHSYGYDNNAFDNDESRIRRKNSSIEHRICSNKDDNDFIVKRKRSGNMSYETIVWVVFFVCNVVILVDRFTGNGDFVFGRKSRFFIISLSL